MAKAWTCAEIRVGRQHDFRLYSGRRTRVECFHTVTGFAVGSGGCYQFFFFIHSRFLVTRLGTKKKKERKITTNR